MLITSVALSGAVLLQLGACPSAEQVTAALAIITPGGTDPPSLDGVEVVEEDGQKVLRLRGSEGNQIAEKHLPADEHCDVLARVVALTLSVWSIDFDLAPNGITQKIPIKQSQALVSPPLLVIDMLPHEHNLQRRPLRPPIRREQLPQAQPSSDEKNSPHADASVSLGAGIDTSGASLNGAVSGGLRYLAWGLRIYLRPEAARSFALSEGTVSFQRPTLGLAASYRTSPSWLSGEFMLGGGVSRVSVSGVGYPLEEEMSSLEWSLEASLRAYWGQSRWKPFMQVTGVWWPVIQRVVLETSAGPLKEQLPPVTAYLSLGLHVDF